MVFPSVRPTENFGKYFRNFARYGHSPAVMVLDETPEPFKHRRTVYLCIREK